MPRTITTTDDSALTDILAALDRDASALSLLLTRVTEREQIADPALLGVLTSGQIVIHAIDTLIDWYLSDPTTPVVP